MFGGSYFAGVPFGGVVALTSLLAANVNVSVTATAELYVRPFGGEVWLGGVNVSGKMRVSGVSIRDVLNDAPNTASLTFGGTAVPQVGLPLEIRLSAPPLTLFSGSLQTVDRSYEGGKPSLVHWPCTAIDDTAAANRRRPFGSWIETSASTIAAAIAAAYAPSFLTRIEADLPPVTIHYDGSETIIAALVRLANMVGGYAKVENRTIYLFIEDTTDLPDPIDLAHRPLNEPPIQMTVDVSQLRTRVYGKGYGENVPTDVTAGETMIPITDGAQFTPLGGLAIAGTTADSAQSQRISYGSVSKPLGGTLVGPGAAPSNAPTLSLLAGGVVTNGLHEVALVYVTATGKSLLGPRGEVTAGPVASPTTAPVAGIATNGTGPDQGMHEYAVTNLVLGGETTLGPVSNTVTTSAASGQIPAGGVVIVGTPVDGSGVDVGTYDYVQTFVNAQGETTPSNPGNAVYNGNIAGGVNPPGAPTVNAPQIGAGVDTGSHTYGVTFVTAEGETTLGSPSTSVSTIENGGQLTPPSNAFGDEPVSPLVPGNLADASSYYYKCTFVTAQGETTPSLNSGGAITPGPPGGLSGNMGTTTPTTGGSLTANSRYNYHMSFVTASGYETEITNLFRQVDLGAGQTAVQFSSLPTHPDPRVTKRNLYRTKAGSNPSTRAGYLVTTINDNTSTSYLDTTADTALNTSTIYYENGSGGSPVGPRGTPPGWQARVFNIPIGPSGTTGRKLYRSTGSGGNSFRLIATLSDNSTTQFIDNVAPASEGATEPTVNTTGQPAHQIPLTNIPTGSGTVTQRRLYRNSGGGGWRLVDTIPNNSATTYLDTKPNASLGANPPATNGTGRAAQNLPITFQTGPDGVTARRIYRRFVTGGGTWKLVTTISDNSTTSYLDTKSNASLGADAPTSNSTGIAVQRVPVTNIPVGPGGTSGRNLYRRFNGATAFRLVTTLSNNSSTTYTDATPNSGLGVNAPSSNTATGNQVGLTQIPTGASQVIAREIYMSLTNGPGQPMHLALTLNDNTTRDGTINMSDATLLTQPLPPAPGTDTSGLTQPTGQVNPGSPTLIVASPAPFFPTGGWVITGGGQVLRYTGITGQFLTGIPASGPGAIVTTILYGQQALPAPTLAGVTGLTKPMQRGAAVHIWVERNDLLAQQEQAARDGSDGVVEFLLVDTRRSEPSLITRCDADLALFSRPIVTVTYATRDVKTRSGKPVIIDLPVPPIHEKLTIQDVTISEFEAAPGLAPRFTVTASSVRFSLEDTLRRLVSGAP